MEGRLIIEPEVKHVLYKYVPES